MATMADWARPARGLTFWTAGWIEMTDVARRSRRLIYTMLVTTHITRAGVRTVMAA